MHHNPKRQQLYLDRLLENLALKDREFLLEWLADSGPPSNDEAYFVAAITGRMIIEVAAASARLEKLTAGALEELTRGRDDALKAVNENARLAQESLQRNVEQQNKYFNAALGELKTLVRTEVTTTARTALAAGAKSVVDEAMDRLRSRTLLMSFAAVIILMGGFYVLGRVGLSGIPCAPARVNHVTRR